MLPNFLTLSRLLLLPAVFVCISAGTVFSLSVALILFMLMGITDVLDGYLARKLRCSSSFGACMDPAVDKMVALTLLFLFSQLRILPLWIPLLFLFRELLISGIRQMWALRGHVVGSGAGSGWMGKAKASMQMFMIGATLIHLISIGAGRGVLHGSELIFGGHLAVLIASYVFMAAFAYENRNYF